MRDPNFAEQIVENFKKTKNIARTANELKLDRALVIYWLKQKGIDIRGQAAYQRGPISSQSVILGSTIAMYRLQKGLGYPSHLAELAGMSTKKISMIEKGEKDVLFSEIVRISEVLGVPISELTEKI